MGEAAVSRFFESMIFCLIPFWLYLRFSPKIYVFIIIPILKKPKDVCFSIQKV